MSLTFLDIQQLRNIQRSQVVPASRFNLLYGNNGSGKTSFLEAIHYLALGRSFRTRLASRIVGHGTESFRILAQIESKGQALTVGIEKDIKGEGRIRINQQSAKSLIEVTQTLPVRLLYTDSRLLLSGPSKLRRQFIDWGVFHVEPAFLLHWQHAQRALKQRNATLRMQSSKSMVELWGKELVAASQLIHPLRQHYIEEFKNVFDELVSELLPAIPLSLTYKPGWNEELGLEQALAQSVSRDMELGYTQYGPHKADLSIKVDRTTPAQDELSQGQQKLLVYALYLAQGIFLKRKFAKSCVYLLDDLPAELDEENRYRIARALQEIDAQVFVTGVERQHLSPLCISSECKMFHVERGEVEQVEIT